MPKIWDGTYLWIWYANQIDNGNLNTMLEQAKTLGITGVLIKFADGSLANDPVSQGFMTQFKELVGPFKNAGFKVGGWIYQYLTDVSGEVDACSQAIDAGADWIVLDAETDVYGKQTQVRSFGQLLRQKYPNFPVGLSSFAISNYHPQVPFAEYNAFVDVMLPQIYWSEMGWDVGVAFHTSFASYQGFGKPIAPTGQAYGNAAPADMAQFIQLVKNANMSGVSWWDWQHASQAQLNAVAANKIDPPNIVVQPGNQIAKDVANSSWYATAVKYVLGQGLMTVDANKDFRPDEPATRAQLAQVLYNEHLHQPAQQSQQSAQPVEPPTTTAQTVESKIANDVAANDWYAPAVRYVLGAGYMHVDDNGNFNPNAPATRAQLAQVVFREHKTS